MMIAPYKLNLQTTLDMGLIFKMTIPTTDRILLQITLLYGVMIII